MMNASAITSTQAIQAILAPAVMISSCALFFLGLSNRYVALLTRIRLLNEEKRNLNYKLREEGELKNAENERLFHVNTQVNALLKSTWHVRNAIMCHIAAIFCFVLTSFTIGVNFFVAHSLIAGIPICLFISGMFLVLSGVICMGLDIFISSKVILIEIRDEN